MTAFLAALAMLAGDARDPVAFEAGGVRVDGVLVSGTLPEVRGLLLVSGSFVEPLAAPVAVAVAPGRSIVVEPGVRLSRVADGFELTAHLRKKVLVTAGPESFAVPCPAAVHPLEKGWSLGVGRPVLADSITVSQAQDDADKNLKDLLKAKEKLEQPPPPAPQDPPQAQGRSPYRPLWPAGTIPPPWAPSAPPRMGPGVPPLYYYFFASYFDAFSMAQAADSQVILTQDEVSPTGF